MSNTDSETPAPKTDAAQDGENTPARRFEDLPPAAQRALLEAEKRRADLEAEQASQPRELGGRGGKDPARFGDWEVKGVAVDF